MIKWTYREVAVDFASKKMMTLWRALVHTYIPSSSRYRHRNADAGGCCDELDSQHVAVISRHVESHRRYLIECHSHLLIHLELHYYCDYLQQSLAHFALLGGSRRGSVSTLFGPLGMTHFDWAADVHQCWSCRQRLNVLAAHHREPEPSYGWCCKAQRWEGRVSLWWEWHGHKRASELAAFGTTDRPIHAPTAAVIRAVAGLDSEVPSSTRLLFLLSPSIFSSHFFSNDFSIAFFFFSLQRVIIILALHPKKPIRSLVIFSHLSFLFRYSHSGHSAHNTNISYHHFFSPFNRAIDFSFSNFFMFSLYCVLSNLSFFFFLVWAYQIIRYFFPIISPHRSLATLSDSSIMTHFTRGLWKILTTSCASSTQRGSHHFSMYTHMSKLARQKKTQLNFPLSATS